MSETINPGTIPHFQLHKSSVTDQKLWMIEHPQLPGHHIGLTFGERLGDQLLDAEVISSQDFKSEGWFPIELPSAIWHNGNWVHPYPQTRSYPIYSDDRQVESFHIRNPTIADVEGLLEYLKTYPIPCRVYQANPDYLQASLSADLGRTFPVLVFDNGWFFVLDGRQHLALRKVTTDKGPVGTYDRYHHPDYTSWWNFDHDKFADELGASLRAGRTDVQHFTWAGIIMDLDYVRGTHQSSEG